MDPQIKRSAVLPSDKGSLSGKELFLVHFLVQKGGISGGLWGAILGAALREAFEYDAERQQEYAEAQQQNAKLLGNVGGDPSKGLVALTANATASAGEEQAAGQKALGMALLVGAIVTGAMTLGLIGMGIHNWFKTNKLQDTIDGLKNDTSLDDASAGDLTVATDGKTDDADLSKGMSALTKNDPSGSSDPDEDAAEALKLDDQADLEKARAARQQKIEDKQKEQGDMHRNLDRLSQGGQMISQISTGASQSAGNFGQAPHTAQAAAQSATAETEKTVQQMVSTTMSGYQQNAADAARDAQETAKALAQIAQAQSA